MRMEITLRYLAVVTVMVFCFFQVRVEAQITDNNWSSVGGGMEDIVNALTSGPDGTLYAGGIFINTASGILCDRVASWNGSAWNSLGSGIGADAVSSLAFASGVGVYAGGTFESAGGMPCSNIAIWDGAIWSPLDSGINGSVYALAVGASGILYAGGDFTMAGGVSCSNIASWNGTNWTPLGTGMNASIYALAIDPLSGVLYAGGLFTSAGGVPCLNIAQWDGANWTPVGTGMNSFVSAIAITPAGMLYAGGSFTTAGGVPCNNIARWDGMSWNALGLGTDAPVYALAVAPAGVLYAGGSFTSAGGVPCSNIARWDFMGSSWTALGSGTNASVSALRLIDTDLYVGGVFTSAAGRPGTVGIAKCSLSLTTYTVDFMVAVPGTGSIYGNAAQTVPAGGSCSEVIPLPADGYVFVNWTGDYTGTDNPLIVQNVPSNMSITANFEVDNAMAVGKILILSPVSIANYTIANFATKPSVTATYTIPFSAPPKTGKTVMKLMNKITGVVPAPTFADLEWTKAVKLVNSKEWLKTETCAATILRLFGGTEILSLNCTLATKITFTNVAGEKIKLTAAASGSVVLMPPSISEVRFTNPPSAITNVAGPNTPITIFGDYFGKSAPSAWLEYLDGTTVKKLKLKVQKPYAFDNYKGEHFKSCMDISNGDSQITVMTPEWPNGWDHGVSHNIVIDNKVARATIPFNTIP